MLHTINLRKLVTSAALPLLTGGLSWFFTRDSMDIYGRLNVPPFAPPAWLFPIVWTILYIAMGISLYLVRDGRGNIGIKKRGYAVFAVQLFFNFLWSIIFFNLEMFLPAAIWLAILIVLIGINIYLFGRISPAAAKLLVPYLIWCIFALCLNIGIFILN